MSLSCVKITGQLRFKIYEGPVGSGKSTLLNIFLDETEDHAGSKQLPCNISIAPQEAWIFEGSIRENILIGAEYDEKWYKEVTQAACLIPDFQIFPNGDETLVGYKGQSSPDYFGRPLTLFSVSDEL